jgi:hypothetical protein
MRTVFAYSEFNFEISISISEIKYLVHHFKKSGAKLTREKKAKNEKKATDSPFSRTTDSLGNISREERKKEANKPLYLFRYE